MRDTLIDINDLSDSKEILLMKPNYLLVAFTILIMVLLGIAIIWMSVSKIDIHFSANGLVRSNEAPSVLRVIYGGRATSVSLTEGQYVNRGDVLLVFDQQTLDIQRDIHASSLETLETEVELLRLYRDSIDELTNHLEFINTDQARAYSLMVQSFLLERETALTQVSESERDVAFHRASAELRLRNANDLLAELQSEQTWLGRYRASVENGRDLISGESSSDAFRSNYLSMFQQYISSLGNLREDRERAQENLDRIQELYYEGQAESWDVDEARGVVNEADRLINSFRQSELSSIEARNATLNISINDARRAISTAEQEVNQFAETRTSPLMLLEHSRLQLLSEIDIEIQQKITDIDRISAEINSIDVRVSDTQLVSPIDGILSLNAILNEGDTIPPGSEIGTITPVNTDSFRVLLQVSNSDIAGVRMNQPIQFRFLALPYQEFGMVDGYVSHISPDSRMDPQTGMSYFLVEAVLENRPIQNHRGDDENILVGMEVEARFITDQKTVLTWLLERMDFL